MTRPIRTGRLRALPAVLPRIIALGAAVSFVDGPDGAAPPANADRAHHKSAGRRHILAC
jgi:hypothetical protein